MISLDTETTGVDLRHGAKPFFVSMCDEQGKITYWEWDVDPLTREPQIPQEDIEEIAERIFGDPNQELVLQNQKFDIAALQTILPPFEWPWEKTHDTLIAGHLLMSGMPHDLTSMALQYLNVNIQPLEDALQEECLKARTKCRTQLKSWKIAKAGDDSMPSVSSSSTRSEDKPWKNDSWLPRALAKHLSLPERYPAWSVLQEYAAIGTYKGNRYIPGDTPVTLAVWKKQRAEIERRGLWKIYSERKRVVEVAYKMECTGISVNAKTLFTSIKKYAEEAEACKQTCIDIAKEREFDLVVPKNVNGSLKTFCFDVLGLEKVINPKAKTESPTLNKDALTQYLVTLDEESKEWLFVRKLLDKRARDSALNYMSAYERFWLPDPNHAGWHKLHPNLNPTGTSTLRWSCYNPNEQNISKREDFNIRENFGPGPGREWFSADMKNIERRIPAYEADEEIIIQLLEEPDTPPYYGSEHLMVAHILHRREFERCLRCAKCQFEVKVAESLVTKSSRFCECSAREAFIDGRIFKERYKATLYQWTKNGNFALQYKCGPATANRTFRISNAYEMIISRFDKQERLNQHYINYARKHGYVETIPDKSVDPDRGFPIMCSRRGGDISPTIPFNYHISGTAMWCMGTAMVRCQRQLDEWREKDGFDGHIVMQIHDEMVFDFPRSKMVRTSEGKLVPSNLWRARILQKLMAKGGENIGIPTPVSLEYHPDNWAIGLAF